MRDSYLERDVLTSVKEDHDHDVNEPDICSMCENMLNDQAKNTIGQRSSLLEQRPP
jgi:hypothetical protein